MGKEPITTYTKLAEAIRQNHADLADNPTYDFEAKLIDRTNGIVTCNFPTRISPLLERAVAGGLFSEFPGLLKMRQFARNGGGIKCVSELYFWIEDRGGNLTISNSKNPFDRLANALLSITDKKIGKRKMTGKRVKDKPLTRKQHDALKALTECHRNIAEAAKRLGISRAAFYERLKGAELRGALASNRSVKARHKLPEDKRGDIAI